jgi:hypothetical protein
LRCDARPRASTAQTFLSPQSLTRPHLGRAILIGLEFLIAADIINTVAVDGVDCAKKEEGVNAAASYAFEMSSLPDSLRPFRRVGSPAWCAGQAGRGAPYLRIPHSDGYGDHLPNSGKLPSVYSNPDGTTRMTLRNRGTPAGFSLWVAPLMAIAMRRANRKRLGAVQGTPVRCRDARRQNPDCVETMYAQVKPTRNYDVYGVTRRSIPTRQSLKPVEEGGVAPNSSTRRLFSAC